MRVLQYDNLKTISHRAGADDHTHVNCELVMILNGTATNRVNDSVKKVGVGDCFFVNTNCVHSIIEDGGDYINRDIYIHPKTLKKICLDYFDEAYFDYLISADTEVDIPVDKDAFLVFANKLADLEIQDRLDPDEENQQIINRCVVIVFTQLLSYHYENFRLHFKKQKAIWMTEFLKIVQQPNIFCSPVEDIIRASGYSHAQFNRLFRQISKITFKEYITKLRINHAKLLLSSNPTRSIEDIASEVGYNSTSHFVQCFKQHTKITPYKYKSEHFPKKKRSIGKSTPKK